MCWAYNRQYGTQYLAVMPTNAYGPGDNYNKETSHVLPALIRKFHEAKKNNSESMTVWGTGTPRREFIYSDDLADACLFLLEQSYEELRCNVLSCDTAPLINIGCGQDQTIKVLANTIKDVVGFEGQIIWDTSKPDGTPQKLLSVTRMSTYGWQTKTDLKEGIAMTYKAYIEPQEKNS